MYFRDKYLLKVYRVIQISLNVVFFPSEGSGKFLNKVENSK